MFYFRRLLHLIWNYKRNTDRRICS